MLAIVAFMFDYIMTLVRHWETHRFIEYLQSVFEHRNVVNSWRIHFQQIPDRILPFLYSWPVNQTAFLCWLKCQQCTVVFAAARRFDGAVSLSTWATCSAVMASGWVRRTFGAMSSRQLERNRCNTRQKTQMQLERNRCNADATDATRTKQMQQLERKSLAWNYIAKF